MIQIPRYIKSFMGESFRPTQGVDARFDLRDFYNDLEFICPIPKGKRGCYIISSTSESIIYANKKKSPILYIGMSDDLYRRLHDEHYIKHLKYLLDDKNWGIGENTIAMMSDKYQYMYYYGSTVDVFYCKGCQEAKEFESMLIANFYKKYRSMPVGNGARSYSQK